MNRYICDTTNNNNSYVCFTVHIIMFCELTTNLQ